MNAGLAKTIPHGLVYSGGGLDVTQRLAAAQAGIILPAQQC
jgi:hypothetical protein